MAVDAGPEEWEPPVSRTVIEEQVQELVTYPVKGVALHDSHVDALTTANTSRGASCVDFRRRSMLVVKESHGV